MNVGQPIQVPTRSARTCTAVRLQPSRFTGKPLETKEQTERTNEFEERTYCPIRQCESELNRSLIIGTPMNHQNLESSQSKQRTTKSVNEDKTTSLWMQVTHRHTKSSFQIAGWSSAGIRNFCFESPLRYQCIRFLFRNSEIQALNVPNEDSLCKSFRLKEVRRRRWQRRRGRSELVHWKRPDRLISNPEFEFQERCGLFLEWSAVFLARTTQR